MDGLNPETDPPYSPAALRRGPTRRVRVSLAILAAGSLIAGGVAYANHSNSMTAQASPAPQSSGNTAAPISLTKNEANAGTSKFNRSGSGRGFTVTAVNGNTITATALRRFTNSTTTITITVGTTTTYTMAGVSAALSDIHGGSTIAVRGTRTGTNTISATNIDIVLPRVSGTVSAVNGNTITLKSYNGTSKTVIAGSSTHVFKAGKTGSLADVTVGVSIFAQGATNSDGSLNAVAITIRLPQVIGQVTAVGSSSFTVTARNGSTTNTIDFGPSTTFGSVTGAATTSSTVTVGTWIAAEGTLSSDGKTMSADRILVLPAGLRPLGGFHRGGLGRGDGQQFGGRGLRPGAPLNPGGQQFGGGSQPSQEVSSGSEV